MRASSLPTPTPTPPPERPRRPVERPPRPAAVSSLPVAKVRTSRAPPAARAAAPTSLSRSPAPRRYDSHRDDSRARSWRRRSTPDTHRADGRVPAATRYSRTTFESAPVSCEGFKSMGCVRHPAEAQGWLSETRCVSQGWEDAGRRARESAAKFFFAHVLVSCEGI